MTREHTKLYTINNNNMKGGYCEDSDWGVEVCVV